MVEGLLYALGVVIFLAALFVSIALHELGHLYHAKRYGCRVSQYMVGFGPTIWSRTIGETEYGVKAVPLGGFVKIIGMFPPETAAQRDLARGHSEDHESASGRSEDGQGDHENESTLRLRRSNTGMFAQVVAGARAAEFELVEPGDAGRLFYQLPVQRKILVMLAGPAVNIALAFFCLLAVYSLHGVHSMEPTDRPVVASVSDCVIPESEQRQVCEPGDAESPASLAGLRAGDRIAAFNGEPIHSWSQLSALVRANGNGPMTLQVERGGEPVELEPTRTTTMVRDVSPDSSGDFQQVGFLGVEPESREVVTRYGPGYTMVQMGELTATAVTSIVQLPVRVWNVALAVVGLDERDPNTPMSVVGGSRLAGEVASSDVEGLDVGGKAALLGLVVGSFNLFIGVFNLIPLLPLDGGHIIGAAWEGLRRFVARVLRRGDPGYVNVAAQLPFAYCLAFAFVSMSVVLMIGDIVVPLRSGF